MRTENPELFDSEAGGFAMSFLGPIVRYVETCRRVISGDPGLSEHFHKGLSRVNELRRKPRAELDLGESRQHVLDEIQRLPLRLQGRCIELG